MLLNENIPAPNDGISFLPSSSINWKQVSMWRHRGLCLHHISDSFALHSILTDHRKYCSEIRERRRAVGGRQIEHSYSKLGQSVGSAQAACVCKHVLQLFLFPCYKMFAFLTLFSSRPKSVGEWYFKRVCLFVYSHHWRELASVCLPVWVGVRVYVPHWV